MKLIANWEKHYADVFGKQTLRLRHHLSETGLFERDALAELIERCPDSHYNLSTMGWDPQNPQWREGHLAGLPGDQVIEAIENGRMWLNVRRIHEFDKRYAELMNDIFSGFESAVPGLETYKHNFGILVSSPKVRVFYHADVPGQALWQIQGKKRLYVYPNKAPFLEPQVLERIILGEQQEEMPYQNWYDDFADVYDLEPGEMVHWPLNGPHRVDNEDCLNVSVTTEHYTDEIRNSYAVNYANGVLRRFGVKNPSQATDTFGVYPKAALTLMWKKLKLNKSREFRHVVDFKPDPKSERGLVDIPSFVKG